MNDKELETINKAYEALCVAIDWLADLGFSDCIGGSQEHIEIRRMIIARDELTEILQMDYDKKHEGE